MAKIKAPLFSFEARGALGEAIVYFPWKGLNCVRQYVTPTNPRTDLQTTQRNRMTAAVDEFHAASYTTLDVSAWTRFAGTLAKVMTGFNSMCRAHIIESILTNTWQRIFGVTSANPHANDFEVECSMPAPGADPVCHYGTRVTFMPDTETLDALGGAKWGKTLTGLTANTDYYFYIDHGSSGTDYGRTGIYKQRTSA